jgi:hypothetical protein
MNETGSLDENPIGKKSVPDAGKAFHWKVLSI